MNWRSPCPAFQTVVRAVTVGAGAAATVDVEIAVELAERVVVVGSRARPRSVTESPVPIDAIPFRDVASQGAAPLDYRLRTLVPSFNVATHPISGAASLVRQVEVLRDGASAQYGSDAIAGVMNFLLKDDRAGGSLGVGTGGYRAGDGRAWNAAGNVGLPLGDTGFANLGFEYGDAGPTDRSVQRADAAALAAAGNTAVADPAQPWGDPTSEDDLKLFGNCGHRFANRLQAYGHANYAHKTSTQGFYYRKPNTRANIFSLDGGRPCSSATCSTPTTACATARPAAPR